MSSSRRQSGLLCRLDIQHFVQRPLTVAFQIERDVLKAESLENGRELPRHLQRERLLHLLPGDLDTGDLTVKAHAELAESERFQLLLAHLDLPDVFESHRSAIWNP